MQEKTDAQLIKSYLQHDKDAIAILVERYQRQLYFFCLRMVEDHNDATELVQKTFVRIVEKLGSLQKHAAFKTWMYKIAVNFCHNLLRERSTYAKFLSKLPIEETYYQHSLEEKEQRDIVQKSLRSLPEKQRTTIILRIYHDLAYQDIADILGCKEVTVRSHFHLGLKSLANKLRRSNL